MVVLGLDPEKFNFSIPRPSVEFGRLQFSRHRCRRRPAHPKKCLVSSHLLSAQQRDPSSPLVWQRRSHPLSTKFGSHPQSLKKPSRLSRTATSPSSLPLRISSKFNGDSTTALPMISYPLQRLSKLHYGPQDGWMTMLLP